MCVVWVENDDMYNISIFMWVPEMPRGLLLAPATPDDSDGEIKIKKIRCG